MIPLTAGKEGLIFALHVRPGASRSKTEGEHDGALKIATLAPPEGGAANREVIRLLAEALKLKRAQLSICAGFTNRRKKVCVTGIDRTELEKRLQALLS